MPKTADDPQANNCPEHQLIAEKTDEMWQQAKPFVCDAFDLDRGPTWLRLDAGVRVG